MSEEIILKGVTSDNYRGIGFLMSMGFEQDEDGKWNYFKTEGNHRQGRHDSHLTIEKDWGLITDGKFNVKFGIIHIEFDCSRLGLTSLIGAPDECKSFTCNYNNIKVLDFIPKAENYNIRDCNIEKITCDFPLEGVTRLNISDNIHLNSFKHFPSNVEQLFLNYCGFTSLEGCPEVSLYLHITGNPISVLKGLENQTVAYLEADYCKLINLEYCPIIIMGANFSNTSLKNLNGLKGLCAEKILLNNCSVLESLESDNIKISPNTIDVSGSNIKTLEHIHSTIKTLKAYNCQNLENVYFKHDNISKFEIKLSGNKINMYTFFKLDVLKYYSDNQFDFTLGQKKVLNYHKTVSAHAGDVITEIGWDENHYYRDMFKFFQRPGTNPEDVIRDINEITWYGNSEILKDIRTYSKSASSVVKFNL